MEAKDENKDEDREEWGQRRCSNKQKTEIIIKSDGIVKEKLYKRTKKE